MQDLGPEGKEKALLHIKLAKVFAGSKNIKVAWPYKKVELHIKDLTQHPKLM
jgi:hypothetical protein